MNSITPFLWFDDNAEDAISHYLSIFTNSKLISESRADEPGDGSAGKLFLATFELEGQRFMALNGGPHFHFTEAISLFVSCKDQDEVDELWERLSEGGEKGQCGWLKDKFGISWQIVPDQLGELMSNPDPARAQRVREAMLTMTKLDIAGLRKAYDS